MVVVAAVAVLLLVVAVAVATVVPATPEDFCRGTIFGLYTRLLLLLLLLLVCICTSRHMYNCHQTHTYQTCLSTRHLTNPLVLARALLHIMNQFTQLLLLYKLTNGIVEAAAAVAVVDVAVEGPGRPCNNIHN